MKGLVLFRNILTAILIAGVVAMGVTAIVRSVKLNREVDAYCRYLDEKYGWRWEK